MISKTTLMAALTAALVVGGVCTSWYFLADNECEVTFPSGGEGFTYELYGTYPTWDDATNSVTLMKGKSVTFIVSVNNEEYDLSKFFVRGNDKDLTPVDFSNGKNADLLKEILKFLDDKDKVVVETVTVTFLDEDDEEIGKKVIDKGSAITLNDYNGDIPDNMLVGGFFAAYDEYEDDPFINEYAGGAINADTSFYVKFIDDDRERITIIFLDEDGEELDRTEILKNSHILTSHYNGDIPDGKLLNWFYHDDGFAEMCSGTISEDPHVLYVEFVDGVTVSLKDAAGNEIGTKFVKKGLEGVYVGDIADLIPEGYYFDGLYLDAGFSEEYEYDAIDDDIDLYVKFVKYELPEGVFVYREVIKDNTEITMGFEYDVTLPDADEWSGYEITSSGSTKVKHKGSFAFTVTVTAENAEYDLVVKASSGSLSVPIKTGNVFKYTVSNITEDVEILIDVLYDVEFVSGAGYEFGGDLNVKYGSDYVFTVTILEGYDDDSIPIVTVLGPDENEYVVNDITEEDADDGVYTYKVTNVIGKITIEVTDGIVPNEYTITVEGDNIVWTEDVDTYYGEESVDIALVPATGYHVAGVTVTMGGSLLEEDEDYEVSDGFVVTIYFINGNVVITGTVAPNSYTIAFNSNGGSDVDPIEKDFGASVDAPAVPKKTGYTFAGWYDVTLTVAYTFTTMPAEDITLYAKWSVNQYTISFNSNDGSDVDPIEKDFGASVEAPEAPTKTGYTFAGWYSDEDLEELYTFTTMPAEDITLYAKWSLNSYSVAVTGDNIVESSVMKDHFTENVEIAVTAVGGYHVTGIDSVYMGETLLTEDEDYEVSGDFTVTIYFINGAVTITGIATEDTYTVTVILNLDDTFWDSQSVDIKIGDDVFKLSFDGDGTYTREDVAVGTYTIYVNDENTGETVEIGYEESNEKILNYYTLTLVAGDGIDSVIGGGPILAGKSANVTAVPISLFTFKEWTADPDTFEGVPLDADDAITMPAYALELTATATEDKFAVIITATVDDVPEDGLVIKISIGGVKTELTDNEDGSYTVSVVPGLYSIHVGEVDIGKTVTVTSLGGSATLDWWTLTVEKGDGISSVSGSGVYLSGELLYVNATADTGYTFKEWVADPVKFTATGDDEWLITMPAYTLELTATAVKTSGMWFDVTFNDGDEDPTISTLKGYPIAAPEGYDKAGFSHGWFTADDFTSEEWDFSENITKDLSLWLIYYIPVETTAELATAVNTGGNIRLLNDMNVDASILSDTYLDFDIYASIKSYEFMLDLNGFDIPYEINFVNNVFGFDVTIFDSKKAGKIGSNDHWYGIMIEVNEDPDHPIVINLKDITAYGIYGGLYTNGLSVGGTVNAIGCEFEGKRTNESPIGLRSVGAYLPGALTYNFTDCTFIGYTGIHFKSGTVILTDCWIEGFGTKYDSPEHWTGGGNETGSAMILESSKGYTPPLNVTVVGGTFTSFIGHGIELAATGGTPPYVESFSVSGSEEFFCAMEDIYNHDVDKYLANPSGWTGGAPTGALRDMILETLGEVSGSEVEGATNTNFGAIDENFDGTDITRTITGLAKIEDSAGYVIVFEHGSALTMTVTKLGPNPEIEFTGNATLSITGELILGPCTLFNGSWLEIDGVKFSANADTVFGLVTDIDGNLVSVSVTSGSLEVTGGDNEGVFTDGGMWTPAAP
ncbi:MAG: InlB B-repeat-containing protein [Methanomassiliicoccaceae archaeon]|nr:InlB B-repeat-containing protein [Methanomassiliicoccaceae archaeon]